MEAVRDEAHLDRSPWGDWPVRNWTGWWQRTLMARVLDTKTDLVPLVSEWGESAVKLPGMGTTGM